LFYFQGLAEQHDVTEQHFSNGVYVKICPGDPRYTQFFLEPIVMAGDATTGAEDLLNLHVSSFFCCSRRAGN